MKANLDKPDAGAAGENVTWDFSKGFNAKPIIMETIKPITGSKYLELFKNANIVVDNGDSSYVYMEIKGDTNKVGAIALCVPLLNKPALKCRLI